MLALIRNNQSDGSLNEEPLVMVIAYVIVILVLGFLIVKIRPMLTEKHRANGNNIAEKKQVNGKGNLLLRVWLANYLFAPTLFALIMAWMNQSFISELLERPPPRSFWSDALFWFVAWIFGSLIINRMIKKGWIRV